MAERRMFAKTIIDSDAFLDMPLSAQALYFHLSMRADDDGFVNNPKRIQRTIGGSDDDFKILLAKNFIIAFESGVIVIKHWKIHNYIRGDRKKDTAYPEEMSLLSTKENGAYTLLLNNVVTDCQSSDCQVTVKCQANGSIGKDSIEEDSIGKNSIGEDNTPLTPQGEEWDDDKHTNVQNFDHLVQTEMNEVKNVRLIECISIWLHYKDGRKPRTSNHYQLQSIRSLANKMFEKAKQYGTDAVIEVVNDSIANNYSGITWNELDKRRPPKEIPSQQTSLEDWAEKMKRERGET